MENAFWHVQELERAQLSSADDVNTQRRPERGRQELFKALIDSDSGQVRSDGSDELSQVCCVEVAERGAVSVVEVELTHRLGVHASPGDDPRRADDRLVMKKSGERSPTSPCGDFVSKVEHEHLVERRSVARER